MTKPPPKKPRSESLGGIKPADVDKVVISISPDLKTLSFEGLEDAYSQRTYERPKGEKVTSRIPQDGKNVAFSDSLALRQFDHLYAVDTNTIALGGFTASATGVVAVTHSYVDRSEGFETFWQFRVPFCLGYRDLKEPRENFAWIDVLATLHTQGHFTATERVGLIVDSDLGRLPSYNSRSAPVFGSQFLPANVQLIYASGERDQDRASNRAIAIADEAATKVLQEVKDSRFHFSDLEEPREWLTGFFFVNVDHR